MVNKGCCCGCCAGLALGYLLFAGSAHGETLNVGKTSSSSTSIENVVNPNENHNFLLRQIDNYQQNIGPQMKEKLGVDSICRYEPSCSEYAKQAVEKHGQVKGGLMAAGRLARCNPLSKGGYDPVM